MDMKKKEYTKPSIKLVEWEFNDAVCNTVSTTSYTKCFNVTSKRSFGITDTRQSSTETWNRVGSDRAGSN